MARKFLDKGYGIKLTVWFKGRLATKKEFGRAVIDRFLEEIKDVGAASGTISESHRSISQNIAKI